MRSARANKVIVVAMALLGAALVILGMIHDEPAAITLGIVVAASASVPVTVSARGDRPGRPKDGRSRH